MGIGYTNLFQLEFTKPMHIFQYTFTIEPKVAVKNQKLTSEIFMQLRNKLRKIYLDTIQTDNIMYSLKKEDEDSSIQSSHFQMYPGNAFADQLGKAGIEIIFKSILSSNSNLEKYWNFIVQNQKERSKL